MADDKASVENLGGRATYKDIINYIKEKYGDVNEKTIKAQIIICTVNHPSRIHFPENKKPRKSNQKYDFLYMIEKGVVEFYDPTKHGEWEIRKNEYGRLEIAKVNELVETARQLASEESNDENRTCSILENHLRDIIVRNLENFKIGDRKLELFVDDLE